MTQIYNFDAEIVFQVCINKKMSTRIFCLHLAQDVKQRNILTLVRKKPQSHKVLQKKRKLESTVVAFIL